MLFPLKDYNPTKKPAVITVILIVINVCVYAYQVYLSGDSHNTHIARSAMIPYEVTHFKNINVRIVEKRSGNYAYYRTVKRDIEPYVSVLTSMFMHGSFWHLFGNMLFLWIFGNNIEDALGKFKFIIFYLLCGAGAALAHVLFNFNSVNPVIGASGAVSGIMGAYLILYPKAKVRTFVLLFFIITFIDIPAAAFLIIWFVFQFFYAGQSSGIAWIAHVGGFLVGLILIKKFKKKEPVIEILQ